MAEQELLKAISARVRRVLYFIEVDRFDKAEDELRGLILVLPTPAERHIRAAARDICIVQKDPTPPEAA